MKILFILSAVIVTSMSRLQNRNDDIQHEDKIHFIYFPTPEERVEIVFNDTTSLLNANLKPATKTIFTIDGFTSFVNTSMNLETKDTFSGRPDVNVIIVDWGAYSGYEQAPIPDPAEALATYLYVLSIQVPKVATALAEFIQFINETSGISYDNVTLIGHSLGCHLAGSTGRMTIAKYNKTIGRIVAEDPSVQFSAFIDGPMRLRRSDAAVVEVYNTNREGSGDMYPATGDISIYVNGGDNQPCKPNGKGENSGIFCHSHPFSYKLYNYLASNATIKACPCRGATCLCHGCSFECGEEGISIGPHIPENARGSYHVKTGYLDW